MVPNGGEMITNQQYKRLMSEYKKTGKIVVSAMKADVHPQTAGKYIGADQAPAQLQAPHTWRTRPDPLEKVWEEAMGMLRDAPELEAKTLFEHYLARPDTGRPQALSQFKRVFAKTTKTPHVASRISFSARVERGGMQTFLQRPFRRFQKEGP